MLVRFLLLLVLLAAGCGDAPESDQKLATLESPAAVGLGLRELPPSVLKSIGLSYGLAVVRAEGMAERAGLRMGYVIYGVNQQHLHSIDDFRRLVAQAGERAATRLLVRRGKNDFYVAMDFGDVPLPRRPAPNPRDTLLRT
jgi:serine protease Do